MRRTAPALERRAAARRRRISARVVRSHDEIAEFNREFWRRQGHEARFEAAWDMMLDVLRMRGERARQPRLRRSVAVLERREG
jgi:hypothetical protein